MQRSILASVGVFIVFLCLASPALAGIFTYQFICDLDGAPPFTDREGGHAILNSETGDLAVELTGLRPNTVYTCASPVSLARLPMHRAQPIAEEASLPSYPDLGDREPLRLAVVFRM